MTLRIQGGSNPFSREPNRLPIHLAIGYQGASRNTFVISAPKDRGSTKLAWPLLPSLLCLGSEATARLPFSLAKNQHSVTLLLPMLYGDIPTGLSSPNPYTNCARCAHSSSTSTSKRTLDFNPILTPPQSLMPDVPRCLLIHCGRLEVLILNFLSNINRFLLLYLHHLIWNHPVFVLRTYLLHVAIASATITYIQQ
ncbi:hypothetical protein V6Z12_D12G018700 [Gossypium hirsutum]